MTRRKLLLGLVSATMMLAAFTPVPERKEPGGAARSPHWRKVRAEYLKIHPACEACGATESLDVHHCLPYHLRPDLELRPDNLICLCEKHGCHFTFGHLYWWESWNKDVRADAAAFLKKVKNRPK